MQCSLKKYKLLGSIPLHASHVNPLPLNSACGLFDFQPPPVTITITVTATTSTTLVNLRDQGNGKSRFFARKKQQKKYCIEKAPAVENGNHEN